MSVVRDPRSLALSVIGEVIEGGAYANLALPSRLAVFAGPQRDKNLATELVYGTLRRLGELDVVIQAVSTRPLNKLDPVVRNILRISVYQIIFLRVPNHAAFDQVVRLAKEHGVHRAAGFINAVLRSVVTTPVAHWLEVISASPDTIGAHPVWIANELEKAWLAQETGMAFASMLEAHNERPGVTLALLPGLCAVAASDQRTRWSPIGVEMSGGDPGDDSRIASREARVQDEGSQLAALLLTRYRPLETRESLLDMCAGPGGKTAVMAAEAGLVGAKVVAWEKMPHRAGLVKDSVSLLEQEYPGVVAIEVGDALDISGSFDRILLDAPCTGLGALRRRPEARWRKRPEDLEGLVALQQRLLRKGLELLRPGGVLAYVTCSPVLAETSEMVSEVLCEREDVELVDTPAVLDRVAREAVPRSRRGSAVSLWTALHGTDAMFIQLLHKKPTG
jgi:16S rRNA (cytosine967-C5)-methyltransferase